MREKFDTIYYNIFSQFWKVSLHSILKSLPTFCYTFRNAAGSI